MIKGTHDVKSCLKILLIGVHKQACNTHLSGCSGKSSPAQTPAPPKPYSHRGSHARWLPPREIVAQFPANKQHLMIS